MKLKKLAEVTMWLPGFAPDDPLPEARCTAEIIAFPLVSQVHVAVPVIDEGKSSDIAERVVEVAADVPAPKPLRSVWPALDGTLHAMLRGRAREAESRIRYIHPSNRALTSSGVGPTPHWVHAWLVTGGTLYALEIAAEKLAPRPIPESLRPR